MAQGNPAALSPATPRVARRKHERSRSELSKITFRSRVTNGLDLFIGEIDERTVWARRFRDVWALHLNDLGGEENASAAEVALARRAAALIVALEQMEAKFATGAEDAKLLNIYQKAASALRRILESLSAGLSRRPRDVTTPLTVDSYLHHKATNGEQTNGESARRRANSSDAEEAEE
jgi:hypothetical protein